MKYDNVIKGPDTLAVCRLQGRRPSARDRWQAFYRLFRMIRNSRSAQELEQAVNDFRVLMYDWRWIRLAMAFDTLENSRTMPLFLRKECVRLERARRLGERG